MSNEELTQQEFFRVAREMGLSRSQIKHLRSNRLFPRMTRVGLGRGKGQRFYYPPEAVDTLNSLVYWRKEKRIRYLEDLRWYLWLYGDGWDWLWEDIRKDLLDLLYKAASVEDVSESDKEEAASIWLDLIFGGRYRLFGVTKKKLSDNRGAWTRGLIWLISEFSTRYVKKLGGSSVRTRVSRLAPSAEIDSMLGDGTYKMISRVGDLYDLGRVSHLGKFERVLIDTNEAGAVAIKSRLQEVEKAYEEDKDLNTLTRILGFRALRSMGLHRLPRLVSVCTLLLLQVDRAISAD